MRVRPFFWAFLATVCVGVLIFAGVVAKNQLYPLQAQIQQVVSNPAGLVVVHLHLADTENQPIDHAMITPDATMRLWAWCRRLSRCGLWDRATTRLVLL